MSTLYLVPTPIGNFDDMTLRGLDTLKKVNFIICEEFREARRLLSHFSVSKDLIILNEHNEKSSAETIAAKLKNGESAALISDCGTPVFSDPGKYLVQLCIQNEIKIVPLPGANALLPALISSGFATDRFFFYGWLSPKKERRRHELLQLKKIKEIIVFMETPYRLKQILTDVAEIMGEKLPSALAFQLTMPDEKIYYGTSAHLLKIVTQDSLKGEFVLSVDNRK